jgi:hypothetical protein
MEAQEITSSNDLTVSMVAGRWLQCFSFCCFLLLSSHVYKVISAEKQSPCIGHLLINFVQKQNYSLFSINWY